MPARRTIYGLNRRMQASRSGPFASGTTIALSAMPGVGTGTWGAGVPRRSANGAARFLLFSQPSGSSTCTIDGTSGSLFQPVARFDRHWEFEVVEPVLAVEPIDEASFPIRTISAVSGASINGLYPAKPPADLPALTAWSLSMLVESEPCVVAAWQVGCCLMEAAFHFGSIATVVRQSVPQDKANCQGDDDEYHSHRKTSLKRVPENA